MRASQAFLSHRTRNVAQPRANVTRLLQDGGFVHPIGKGLYAWLPTGMRLIRNIQAIIAGEIQGQGGEEFRLPLLNPINLREASGRDRIGAEEFLVINDRFGAVLLLQEA